MKKLLALLIILFTVPVIGQNHLLGLKGGISATNVFSNSIFSNTDFKNGFIAGLTYEYRLKKTFHLEADLLYANKGFEMDIIFTDETGSPTGDFLTSKFHYNYISIPLKFGASFGKKLSGFANIGLVPSFLTKAIYKTPALLDYEEINQDNTEFVNSFDLGAIIEFGGTYTIQEKYFLFASLAYQQSFTGIIKDNPNSSNMNHYGMIFSVGVKYALTTE